MTPMMGGEDDNVDDSFNADDIDVVNENRNVYGS